MNGQELATAIQYKLNVIFIVIDNGMYGTIRMHQERNYPARVHGTDIVTPTSRGSRKPTGANGEAITPHSRVRARARSSPRIRPPVAAVLKVDPQAITMSATIDQIRAQSAAKPP